MKLVLDNIILTPAEDESVIADRIRERWGVEVRSFTVLRKSLDARKKTAIVYRFRVMADVTDGTAASLLGGEDVTEYSPRQLPAVVKRLKGDVVHVAGSGPAGLFCALRLIAAGVRVELFERGRPVNERMRDIAGLEMGGILDETSNVLFGEGGAGT